MKIFSRLSALVIGALVRFGVLLITGAPSLKNKNLPQGPAVLFAKHSSHFDTLILWAAADAELRARLRPVAAADYWGKDFPRRWIARAMLNAILVERKPSPDSDPLARMEKALQAGECLLIFPEGSRLPQRHLGPFKSGIFRLAQRIPDLNLVPTYIANAGRTLPKGDFLPTPVNCQISVGDPIQLLQYEQKKTFLKRARNGVYSLSTLIQTSSPEGTT